MLSEPVDLDPILYRRRLRSTLRSLREGRDLTQAEVASRLEWSQTKVRRIETASVRVATADLRELILLYAANDDSDELMDIAKAAKEKSPWSMWKDTVSPEFMTYLCYESSASIVRSFEPKTVPALLQTEEYAALIASVNDRPDRVAELVDLCIQRQGILAEPDRHPALFIVDEAALRRIVGDHGVMRRQLLRILDTAQQNHVSIRVVPFARGPYPHMQLPYTVLGFESDQDDDVVCVENSLRELVVNDSVYGWDNSALSPTRYLEAFWVTEQIAPEGDATRIIETIIGSL